MDAADHGGSDLDASDHPLRDSSDDDAIVGDAADPPDGTSDASDLLDAEMLDADMLDGEVESMFDAAMDADALDGDIQSMPDADMLDAALDGDIQSMPDADMLDAALDARSGDSDASDAADASPVEIATTVENLRLAFFGDQGLGSRAVAVLQLVKDEQADLVIHGGDFDYTSDPVAWEAQIDGVLGHDFPYFALVGNHDLEAWPGPGGYQDVIAARVARIAEANCSGDLGVNAVCRFRGLAFVLSGVGTYGTGHEAYLNSTLGSAPEVFKLCAWHKDQHDMQVGTKTDEVGWLAYRVCQGHGALVLTAHEHSYSRTYALSALGYPALGHGFHGAPANVILEPGSTAVVVSGLGGSSRRPFAAAQHPDIRWWASIYANNYQVMNGVETGTLTSIEDGALFIDFHVDGDPYKARAYFKTVSGAVVDTFVIRVAH